MNSELEKEICIEFGRYLEEYSTPEEITNMYEIWKDQFPDQKHPLDFGCFLTEDGIDEIGPKFNEFLDNHYPDISDNGTPHDVYNNEYNEDYRNDEKETFNFLTDGMGLDYDEFKMRGGDLAQLKDELGLD